MADKTLGNLQDIDKSLGTLLRSNRGIQFVLLSDKTGLSVSSVTRLLVRETTTMDLESIGAIAAAVFCGSEEQGNTSLWAPWGFWSQNLQMGRY